jgi:hypothetical protein
MLKNSEIQGVGELSDRYQTLSDNFSLPLQEDIVEEFDGLNHEVSDKLVFVVALPILQKSHAIQVKVASDLIQIRVPNLYKLELGLPTNVVREESKIKVFFENQLRKLFVILTVAKVSDAIEQEDEGGETTKKNAVIEIVDTKKLESDLLFDVV